MKSYVLMDNLFNNEPNFNDDIPDESENELPDESDQESDQETDQEQDDEPDTFLESDYESGDEAVLDLDDNTTFSYQNNKKSFLSINHYTKYEIANLIGTRAVQIAKGSKIYININTIEGKVTPINIAKQELKMGKMPLKIRRCLPGGSYEFK